MNWNKGAKTKGRGKSAKDALRYYLHDKDKAQTSERVGFVVMRNLVTDNPHEAWREMMATCDAAPELQRRAGKKPRKKPEQPYYVISLNWHPDDKPSAQHMIDEADEVVRLLGLHDHQAEYVEHKDEPHPHVHITINLINPNTGILNTLPHDERKLERWADNYELRTGVIRSPERRAKFAALDAGLKPEPKPKTPKRFQEPDTKPANDDIPMRQRAQAIRDQQRAYAARLKATQDEAWKRRKNEHRALWLDYRTARQAIRARRQFHLDQIYKHKRNRHALPLSIQGFRDWKESREWKALMARLKADRRRFEYRERTLLGFVGNAIALLRPGMLRTGKTLLPMLFNLLVSGKARREIMAVRQGLATRALSDKQFGKRKVRADKIRLVRDAQMQTLAAAFDIQKQALEARHAQEIDRQKQEWRELATERTKLWDEWKQEFGMRERQRQTARGGHGGDTRAAPPPRPRTNTTQQFLGAGKPVRKTAPKPDDSRIKTEFEPAASKEPPQPKPGWKQRRSAAERRADGSYKPRPRNEPKPKF